MTKELKQLTTAELEELHHKVIDIRETVSALVDEYGFSASQLVSRTFEHDIETEYGRKTLKALGYVED